MGFLIIIFLFIIFLIIYFLPTIVAISRCHKQSIPIFAINLLLGTTLLFWVIAFVWATLNDEKDVL